MNKYIWKSIEYHVWTFCKCIPVNILYISLHTAPEDPPMEFSTILASDNARLAGTPTGKPGLSFGPKFWRMAVGMTEKYEIYVLNDFLHQKLLFVLNVNLFGTNRRYSYSFHSIPPLTIGTSNYPMSYVTTPPPLFPTLTFGPPGQRAPTVSVPTLLVKVIQFILWRNQSPHGQFYHVIQHVCRF